MLPRDPILTPRLQLRAFSTEDASDLFEYLSDPRVYVYEPGDPVDRDQALYRASEMAGSPDFWAVELLAEKKVIGQVYFSQVEPHHIMTWELGYILSPKYHRSGYASEAARALVAYGFRRWDIHRVIAHCNPDNLASWKLLEKVGFRREGLMLKNIFFRRNAVGEPAWTDTFLYALLAEEAGRLGDFTDSPK